MPLIRFNKIYIDAHDIWLKADNYKITDDKYILYNQQDRQKKSCSNKERNVVFYISRIITSKNFSNYISKASNEFCEIDRSGICFKKSINKI